MADKPKRTANRIESLDERTMEVRLRDVARGLSPGRLMDDLEVQHLIRVVTECSLLQGDVYSDERIARIMHPRPRLLGHLLDRLLHEREQDRDAAVLTARRLPDEVRLVGDKALFDLAGLTKRRIFIQQIIETDRNRKRIVEECRVVTNLKIGKHGRIQFLSIRSSA